VNTKFLPDFAQDMQPIDRYIDDTNTRASPTRFTSTPQKQSFYVEIASKDNQQRPKSASSKPFKLEDEGGEEESSNQSPFTIKARHFSE